MPKRSRGDSRSGEPPSRKLYRQPEEAISVDQSDVATNARQLANLCQMRTVRAGESQPGRQDRFRSFQSKKLRMPEEGDNRGHNEWDCSKGHTCKSPSLPYRKKVSFSLSA